MGEAMATPEPPRPMFEIPAEKRRDPRVPLLVEAGDVRDVHLHGEKWEWEFSGR